ncbi:Holliday junction resolvase RuvX [Salinibacterium sp. SYSU T00001]|uniref:Holliday junction resolvase RuvX n=1 Tax=Homoserinimonas sedimenticola TaxID=2986805 RepID=UPI0022357B48|nr:Holliday junction resolvase RuvX [Salinibacterium sedimenticola]MCW4384332.1 Holliday junction resolvase RuvX [Salinibacterium sedimenticola]
MRAGVRLGVDVGRARIGLARSDLHGMLATPVETVPRGEGDVATIAAAAREFEAVEVVVGLPLSLSGASTASTEDARAFALLIAREGVPVRLVDERLSTVTAQQALRANGRTSRNSRAVVDQVAAVIILQHALDAERSSGKAPGTVVDPHEGHVDAPGQ